MNTDQRPTIAPEVGKRYVTRDGQVTPPLQPYVSSLYPFTAKMLNDEGAFTWMPSGRFHKHVSNHHLDLVAEYVPTADDHANDLRDAIKVMAAQTPPLKNRSGTPASTSSSNLGHPQDAIVIGYDMAQPHPVDGWHGPLTGPLRVDDCDVGKDVARWNNVSWDFRGWRGCKKLPYLVRKGTALAAELGLEEAPMPYPDHTPPELPSSWHRWEYRGENVAGLQPPWYAASPKRRAPSVIEDRVSTGFYGEYYFQAVPTVPLLQVNGIWFPEPQREPLGMGQHYFFPAPASSSQYGQAVWDDDEHDNRWLTSGLIHLTAEAATSHARAMLSLAAKGGAQ